jgi:ATP-dependent RNA helicase RhlE
MTDFSSLGLSPAIAKAPAARGYERPTPIQAQAIPHVVAGRDLLGIAQTGTGKTAAFALPILDRLVRKPAPAPRGSARVLVLAPTRELASQIAASFRAYAGHEPITVATVFGGVPINRHIRESARGVHVLVATPGRLIDLIDRNALTLRSVEVLVLDEADQMLDLGFVHALRRIVPLLPRERQTLFFSATMPPAIADLASKYLRDPERVSVTPPATTAERVDQSAFHVPTALKPALLAHVLSGPGIERALVFTRTKHGADKVVRKLAGAGIGAAAIHGNKSQPQRERALAAFRAGACRVLVATDIAARGVDVPGVSHVINYEIPNVPEQYVHRIGRTARAGAAGLAISFVAPDEKPYLRDIEKLTRQTLAMQPAPHGLAEAAAAMVEVAPERSARPVRERGPERSGDRSGERAAQDRPGGQPRAGQRPAAAKPRPQRRRRRRAAG